MFFASTASYKEDGGLHLPPKIAEGGTSFNSFFDMPQNDTIFFIIWGYTVEVLPQCSKVFKQMLNLVHSGILMHF